MGIAVNLDRQLVDVAKAYTLAKHRSTPKQIEYLAKIGRIASENKDLTYDEIQNILLRRADVESGNVEPYKCGTIKKDTL